jgi:hypothetical protein
MNEAEIRALQRPALDRIHEYAEQIEREANALRKRIEREGIAFAGDTDAVLAFCRSRAQRILALYPSDYKRES